MMIWRHLLGHLWDCSPSVCLQACNKLGHILTPTLYHRGVPTEAQTVVNRLGTQHPT